MTRHIVWQAALAVLGIALVFIILSQLGSNVEVVPEEMTIEVPAAGGTYVEGVLGFSEIINPVLAPHLVVGNLIDQDLSALVFDGLTALDESGQVVPALAVDWDISEDGTIYEFRLRQDVRWHDGAPFSANDVAFTVQVVQDPGFPGDPNLSELWRTVTVYVVDENTVRFTLDELFPSFLYYTTMGLLPAHLLGNVPVAELRSHAFSTEHPVGTGRFKVSSISSDQVLLAPNAEYRDAFSPLVEEIAFWFYGDWEGILEDYAQGIVHGFHPPGLQEAEALADESNLQLYSAQSAGYVMVYLNLDRETAPFFQEPQVRQALLYALDRQVLVDEVVGGQGIVAHSPILPTTWAYDPSVPVYGYDPERAIGLLDASGWQDSDADFIRDQDGVDLAFTLLVNDDPIMVEMAERVADQWRVVGVDATVAPASAGAETRLIRNRDFDASLVEIALSADPDPYPLWHSTQIEEGQNFAGYASEEADVVLEAGRLSTDPEEQLEQYHAFQHLFAQEVPSLLLYYPIYTYAVDRQVREVQLAPLFHASDRFRNFGQWYMQTEEVVIGEDGEIVVTESEELDKTDE